MTTYSPISYDQIVANIRADAEKIAAGRQYPQEASEPVTAPSFDEYARGLGYDGVDFEGKENIKRSWLNQHGQAWRQAGANPEDDLVKYAQTIKPVRSAFDTDWLDLAKQAANRSISGISNVIANELPAGSLQQGFQKQGAEYAGYARENAANFSDVTKDRLAREAREQREVEAAGGGELGAAALTARHVSERPIATLAQAAGSMATQLPGLALQGVGGALAATGVGVAPGAGLITAGRVLNTATSAASVAGEVGQGAYDMVMNLPISKVQNHPEFVRALTDAKSLKLSDSEAQLVAHRAVASMAMSEGTKYGLGIGAASGAISGGFGAGKIAEEAGKKVAGAFLKRAGIEFVSEGTEEAVGQAAQNKAANSGGAAVPLTKGTGSAFVEGAAGGLGLAGAGAAVGKTASAVVDKALDIATRPNVKPTTKGELMDKVSTGMPQYLQEAASDLIDTIIANPNPTPEMQSEIDASKAQLISMGMSEADIDGLFAENVAPDPLVNVPSYTDGPAKDVMVGSYKPAETGGRPGTEAPTRLVTELAKEGELTLEAVNNVAGQHEKSYETWVVQTQSQPSRVPTQEFISGTADNMVVTALNLGLPMDAELRTYAEAKALELAAVQDTDPNNLGSRLMADGETLMSESQYQATQMGTAENLIGEYVLYGNAEGYVVQRPNGLYVVDTRPGNTQDIFIESGLSGQSPASIGIKLMAPPKIKVPAGAKSQTPAQLVAEAQLTYDQIKLNDALDLLVLSVSATEAEAFLEALDQRLATNATPGQVAQEIENEINKVLPRDGTDSGAVSSQDVPAPDANERYSQPAGGSGLNTSAPSDSAPAAEVAVWTADSAKERITQWLQANGGAGQIRSDVRILDKLPGFVTGELQQGVDAGELEMRGPGAAGARGPLVDSVEKMAVFGARRKDASYLFPANTPVDVDPVRVLIHETWHKYQNADTVLRLHEQLDRWSQSPTDSLQHRAWARGEEVIADASDVTGGMNERIPKILDFLWENSVRPDQRTGMARWMDTAIAAVRHVMRHMFGRDLKWTTAELMTFAQKMVLDDSNGKEATQYLGEKTKAARREVETKAAKAIAKPRFSTADIAKLSDRGVPLKEFAQQFAGDIKQKDRDVADADKIALDYFDQVVKDPMSVLPLVKGSSLSYKQYLRMPDGLDYDPQNINHITATDLTKSVYAAVKSGRIEAALEGEAKATNESRAQDLRSLARYLRGNQEYRTTEAAVMLKAAAKWGMRLSTNNDQATVELVEITNKNATAIAVLGGLDAAALSEQMRAGKPLKTAFRDALQQTVDARERAAKASGKDGWVVYKKSDKHEDAVALRDGCAGREWCTAGAVSTAAMQLRQGDFHVFYRDGQPVVALRTVNGRLGEAPRGSLKGQGLTDFERGVAERRLRGQPESIKSKNLPAAPTQPNVTGGEDFLDDQAFLASMQSAVANNFKDYNDHQLFLLQGHQMRAGDYTGGLPASLQTAIEKELYKRKPKATWAVEGYMLADDELFLSDDGGRGTVRQPNPSVKYIVGSVELYGDNSLLNVEVVTGDVVLKGDNDAPKLQVVGGSLSLDGTSTAEAVQQVGGNVVVYSDASLPALRVVGGGLQADPAQWVVGVKTNVGRETALEGTPLDPSYGSAPVAQVQPTVTGGEDFLDDQKVLADIQSGAIKGYSDYALFTLQAYRMKAGDYVGDQLPEAALEKVWDTIQERDPSVKSWQSKGYWNVRDILTKDDLGSVKVLVGDIDDAQRTLVKWGDFSVPELLDLRIAGLAADVDLQLDAPKLLRADELSLKLDSNVPSLQEVGTLEVDTRVQIPNLSVVGPGTLFAIHPPTTTKQSSYPHILSLLPETKFILRDRIPGVKYDLRKIFPSAAMGGEMDFSGFDSQIKEFGDTEAAPPALPKVDVERALAPASTQVQPLVTGGEDFLDDQKVLNDIQSGAIKQYSDARLWMLQGYRLKAGDYSGDKLPLAARETVEAAVRARKSIAKWNKDGYHESLNSTVDSKEVLSAARYVYGRVYASRDVQMPDLVEADSIDAYSSNFPNLEVVHARHGISLVASTAPKLHTGFGTAVVDKTSLPALRNIGSIRIDADKKPLSFDSLENVTSIYAARNGIQNLSFPKLKKVAQEALFAGTILSPLLESVGNKDTNTSSGTTFSAVVKPGSNFESLRWVGLGATMVGRGFTFPSLQVVVGGLHLNDLDASQFPALEAAGKVYADKSKALEAAPLLNRVGYKITGKKGESISATGIETGVKHAGVIKNTILDPEYNANDPRFALKTSVPLISGGEAFLQEQALLDKIKNNDFDGYSDFDLFSLRYHTVEGDGYESTSLSPVAIEAIDKAVLARHSNAEWMALGYYDDLVAGRNWTGQANPKVFVGDTIEITSQEMADKLSTLEIAPRLKFDATITGDISFSKLRKVNSIYIDYTKNGPHKSPSLKFTALEEVVEDIVEPTSFTGELYVPKLRTIGKGLSDLSDAPSNLKSNYPALTYVNAGFVENSVRLPKLTSGFIFPEQVGFDASVSAPLLPEDNINWDFARDSDGNDVDFSVADRLRTAAPRAQPRSLADRLTIIERGELKTKLPVWQDLKDWIVKTMIDGTRPFEAWAREFGTSADQAALNQKKSLARTRVAAYISEIDGAYTRPLAAALSEVVSKTKVKDTIAAKELVGTWMTVRYAQIKNAEFLQQDQAAVDEAEQAFIAAGGNMVGLRAELQAFSTSTPSATRLTLRSERAAKRFAKASDATRAASRAYVTALTKQEDRLKAVSDPNKNLDPVKTPLDAGLAGGYNNATAAEVQRLIEAKIPRALLDKASAPVYAMIQANTQKDLRNGKISLLAYSKWPAQPLYVPLTGDPRTDDTTSDVFGTGSVNQSKDKRAEGRSSSLAQNGIDAAYEQVGKSSQYHGWLPFKQELTKIYERLLTENNNDASTVYEKYGIKRTRETAMTDLSNSVVFRYGANRSTEGGWAYTFDSVAAIEALRHANVEQRPGWLAPIGWATTTAAKLITQFTPGFAVINAFRDGPERFLNLSTRKLANYPGLNMNKVARDAALVWSNPLTIAAARVVLAERLSLPEVVRKVSQSVPDFTPEATKYLREMLGEGASSTTGAYLSRDSGDLAEKLVKINGWPAKTKNMLVVWNDSFELKAPLAMYTALRENGVDKEAAAATVLGTMDFGKAGTAMAPIKALYMFAQPIATGSNELVKTIATTKGKAYAVAMTTAAMGLYAMLSDMAGEDPETKRKRMASISSSTLERSIPVIQPDGTVLKVPVPFGLFQLTWGTGANIMRALNGEQSVAETLGEISKLGFKTFSPISPSETSVARDPLTWAVQTFTPTELKPIANAALNKGAFGGKLDSREFLDPSQPKWKYAKPGTPETYVEASKWLLRNTGMNMSPEVMRELSRVVAVGPLAEVQKGFIDNPHKDALGIKRQSQWFDRYMTTQTPADVVAPPYYHALDQVSDLKKRVEAGERVGDRDRQLLALAKSDETARKSRSQLWSALRKQENGGTIKPEAYRERYQQLKALELQAQRRFLVNFERLTK